jgi:hypothetical protein
MKEMGCAAGRYSSLQAQLLLLSMNHDLGVLRYNIETMGNNFVVNFKKVVVLAASSYPEDVRMLLKEEGRQVHEATRTFNTSPRDRIQERSSSRRQNPSNR